jgi:uncharacterized membrane protein
MTQSAAVWVLFAATILGLALTVFGIVSAYFSAKREVALAHARIPLIESLMQQEIDEKANFDRQQEPREFGDFEDILTVPAHIAQASEARFAAAGLTRPSLEKIELLSSFESVRILSIILHTAKGDLLTAGAGVVVSTMASLGSLFL